MAALMGMAGSLLGGGGGGGVGLTVNDEITTGPQEQSGTNNVTSGNAGGGLSSLSRTNPQAFALVIGGLALAAVLIVVSWPGRGRRGKR